MKYLLSILLFTVIALAVPAPQNGAPSPSSRFNVTPLDGSAPAQPNYLGLDNGRVVATNDTSKITTMYLDPPSGGMLYTSGKIPCYLLPINDSTVYEFHCGNIPKVAGVESTKFSLKNLTCSDCTKNDKLLAYAVPKDGNRDLGQWRAQNVSGDQPINFYPQPPPVADSSGSVSVLLIQETT